MKAQSAMEYLKLYGWIILIVMITAVALYALGVFNPATYTTQPPAQKETWSNCTAFFFPAEVWHVENVDSPTHVMHMDDDQKFLDDLRNSDVRVYCYDSRGLKCGAFNNLGVFHWAYAHCNLE
jgi:hypothetical protein